MRSILCPECASEFQIHAEDTSDGWLMRKVPIKAQVPTDGSHRIQVFAGETMVSDTPVPVVLCDACNQEIQDGSDAVAVSMHMQNEHLEEWWIKYNKI